MSLYGTYCRLNLPVWATNREVVRAARRKLKRSVRRAHKHREARHAILRELLEHHAHARAEYAQVMGGTRLNQTTLQRVKAQVGKAKR